MKKLSKNSKNESINFSNLIKYWIKLKTIDSNHLNFGLISEKRLQLQRLLFEKGLFALDTEFLVLEQKFFYLISCLDIKNREFVDEFSGRLNRTFNREAKNRKESSGCKDYWMQVIQTDIQHHQTYELIKLNITDLITQWTRVYNECWIYNDRFDYQIWFKNKFEQFKIKIRSYQCTIIYKLVVNLFNSMNELIKSFDFKEKEEYLELLQTILLQLTVEIEIYFKTKRIPNGYQQFSSVIIKKIAYLNSRRCNLNLLNNLPSASHTHNLSGASKPNSIDLIGRLKDNAINKRKWFKDLNDLGLIEINKNLFEKFTDHSFRTWFQPDEQSSFDSSNNRSIDKSLDKSIEKIYDKPYNRTFDRINDKKDKKEFVKVNSKFNDLVSKQQILCLSYQSLQLVTSEPNSKLIDYLEKVYWNQFWFNLNFQIQHSNLKLTFQSLLDEEVVENEKKTNQFHKLLDNIRNDFLIEEMFRQFYEFKLITGNRKERMITNFVDYITSTHKLCSNQLIKVNTDRQKTISSQFAIQIDEILNSISKMVEKIQEYKSLEELIFVVINIEPLIPKIKLIESSYQSEQNFNYTKFFSKILIHLCSRLEMLLEYKIGNLMNQCYLSLSAPTVKPNDWMQKLIDEVFQSILKFKVKPLAKSSTDNIILNRLEQIYIRKFNLFLAKVQEFIHRNEKKSMNKFKDSLQFYMNWISVNYDQHLTKENFPNYFLELLEQNSNMNFEDSRLINRNKPLINRNRIAPQYESHLEYLTNDDQTSFRHVQFKSDIEHKLKFTGEWSYLKVFFCFDTK